MFVRALLVFGATACAPPARGPLAPSALMRHVHALADPALDGRAMGSEGEAAAAHYATAQLRAAGLAPVVQPANGTTNVYAVLPGRRPSTIVIGAHLDHLGRRGGALHPGADDDGSGVAVVLGLAHALAHRALDRTVVFVLFGGEEQGFVGSRYFVAHAPVPLAEIAAMVNLDMIGRPLLDQLRYRIPVHLVGIRRARAIGLVGTRRFPALRTIADAAFEGHVVAAEDFPAEIDGLVEAQTAGRSDSVAFEQQGIPALFFGDGESRDYHRPTDTPDRLHPELLARHARALERVVVALAVAPDGAFARSEVAPPRRKPSGWFVPFGFSSAMSFGDDRGYVYGGELSVVYLARSLAFAGVYADLLRDRTTARGSIGAEVGKRWFGIDAGYVRDLERDTSGFAVRPFATTGVVSLGVRVGYLASDVFVELGLLVKYPLGVHTR